ncbi:MAG: hydroxymethylbilane synthase [Sphingomonadales bacterium]
MISQAKLRIGTRGSPLALAQAHEVRDRLVKAHGDLDADCIDIVVIKTSGDRILDRPLADIGGKGLFTKEIEDALLTGDVDLAVHSFKDVATVLPPGLVIDCVLEREDPRDAFISLKAQTLADLPAGSVIGTASLRRQAQILELRPELEVVNFRGNVQTRLRKLQDGVVDATLLACAGLRRLGKTDVISSIIEVEDMLPAVAQGAIAIETRENDPDTARRLTPLNHAATRACVAAERALLEALDGSCRTPIAGLAQIEGDGRLVLRAALYTPDGAKGWHAVRRGPVDEARRLGHDAGDELKRLAGPDFPVVDQ